MKSADTKKYKIVIILTVVFLVFGGCAFFLRIYSQSEALEKPSQNDLQPTLWQSPVPSLTTGPAHYDYCFIEEVHPDFLKEIPHVIDPNATIVHLISDDLKSFPEYQKRMADQSKLSEKWRDGHRSIAGFKDYQSQFSDFQKLSCKYSSYPLCNPRQAAIYEYNGRYFTVRCFPDFGRNAPPPPPPPPQ
jgi:hypothetical protein